jgi:hypothetical protein
MPPMSHVILISNEKKYHGSRYYPIYSTLRIDIFIKIRLDIASQMTFGSWKIIM